MTNKAELHPETLAAQGLGRVTETYREIVPPIHLATTYERGADGSYPGGRVYSRADNPTYDQAEALIASLEHAKAAMLFSSGQAASAAVFTALLPGDNVLVPRNMYWAFRKWLLEFAAPRGLGVELYDNVARRPRGEGARAQAARDLDRDARESDLGHHRHRRGKRDRPRGRRDRRRRFDRGYADAHASHRARRATS